MRTVSLVLVLLAACLGSPLAFAKPAVFENLTPEEAIERADSEGKVVVIDFTAAWCGPCKTMDRITWSNKGVVEWLREHTVPIQVDVDRDKEVARKYRINVMPTVLVLKEGRVVSRSRGLKNAQDFLRMMKRFERAGTIPSDDHDEEGDDETSDEPAALEENAADREASAEVGRRLQNASNFLAMRRYPEATAEYLWLWENMTKIDPATVGVRHVGMATEMRTLASNHPRAKIEFTKLRDELTPSLRERPIERRILDDWLTLTDAIGDEDGVLAFVEEVKDEPGIAPMLAHAQIKLTPLLVARGRWADAGQILDVDACCAQFAGMWEFMGAGQHRESAAYLFDAAATQYAAFLAAKRDEDASIFADEVIALAGPVPVRVAFVERAVAASAPRQEHRDWLDEAARQGADVRLARESLDRALAGAPGR